MLWQSFLNVSKESHFFLYLRSALCYNTVTKKRRTGRSKECAAVMSGPIEIHRRTEQREIQEEQCTILQPLIQELRERQQQEEGQNIYWGRILTEKDIYQNNQRQKIQAGVEEDILVPVFLKPSDVLYHKDIFGDDQPVKGEKGNQIKQVFRQENTGQTSRHPDQRKLEGQRQNSEGIDPAGAGDGKENRKFIPVQIMQRNHVDQSEQAHPPIRPKGNVLGESKAESQQGDRKNRQDQSRFPAGIFSVTTEIYG